MVAQASSLRLSPARGLCHFYLAASASLGVHRRLRIYMLILGIETSCDETAAAVVADGRRILSSVVATQFEAHAAYGGVVPEIAARRHLENILPVIEGALDQAGVTLRDLDGLAVTQGPGLVGALVVGMAVAKALSFTHKLPLAGVHHLRAHILAAFLTDNPPAFPLVALVVSGGHTNLYRVKNCLEMELLGRSRDDAAGEAFDKVAKLMQLGYPGGVRIEALAAARQPQGPGPAPAPYSGGTPHLQLQRPQDRGGLKTQEAPGDAHRPQSPGRPGRQLPGGGGGFAYQPGLAGSRRDRP